jgi:hypothetical protein
MNCKIEMKFQTDSRRKSVRLYFRGFVAHFNRLMTRWFFGLMALVFAAQFSAHADVALVKSDVLENNVAYLRVSDAGKNLADEINAAESALSVSNKTVGTILDLRFANGDAVDAARAVADFFAAQKKSLVILVNGETRGAAEKLAAELRDEHVGLVFGSATSDLQPDIAVTITATDEKKFFENPYLVPAQTGTNVGGSTNNYESLIDHTSEADLVRQKIKDGAGEDDELPTERPALLKPVIRDPALARAVDFLKALAVLQPSRG